MANYKRLRYLLMATDPVHIGTGGYRPEEWIIVLCASPVPVCRNPRDKPARAARLCGVSYETPEAAGQDHGGVANPDKNPVCYTFGYIKKEKDNEEDKVTAYSGVVNIFDAHVLLFPVHSMAGRPVWVSTVERLSEAGFDVSGVPEKWDEGAALLTWERQDALNLGWLMVDVAGQVTITAPGSWKNDKRWQTVKKIALVQDTLFSHIINSNLEVRTSVAIDPERGAPKTEPYSHMKLAPCHISQL